jgi:hypothetical protein
MLVLVLLLASTAAAETTDIPLFGKERTFKGIFDSAVQWFRVPELWEPKGTVALRVTFRFSAILDLEMSSLTLYLNGRPGQSVRLINFKGQAEQWVEAELRFPSDVLTPGWNKMELKAYLRSRTHDCDDRDNPGLWTAVSPRTVLQVSWEPKSITPDLARFPATYTERIALDEKALNLEVVVPASAGTETLSLAGTLSALVGQAGDIEPVSVKGVVAGQQAEPVPNAHLILVGIEGAVLPVLQDWGLEAAWKKAAAEAQAKPDAALAIELQSPKYAWRRVLVVTATQPAALTSASRFFGFQELREELKGSSVVITEPRIPELPPPPSREIRTFDQMRVHELLARGYSGIQDKEFYLDYPSHWVLGERTRLVLFIRHARILAPRTMLEVDLGDTPIASVPLVVAEEVKTPEGATAEKEKSRASVEEQAPLRVEIPIPTYLLDGSGRLYLTFRFMIEVDTRECSLSIFENAWVNVEGRSYLELERVGTNRDVLSAFPDLFLDRPHMQGLVAVLSARTTPLFDLVTQAMVRMGARAGDDVWLAPTVMDETAWAAATDRTRNVLLVAPWKDSLVLPGWAEKLPARFDSQGDLRSPYKDFGHTRDFYQESGLVGIANSPDDPERSSVVYATAFDPGALARTGHFLNGWFDPGRLKGNLLVIKTQRLFYLERLLPNLPAAATIEHRAGAPESAPQDSPVPPAPSAGEVAGPSPLAYGVVAAVVLAVVALALLVLRALRRGSRGGRGTGTPGGAA